MSAPTNDVSRLQGLSIKSEATATGKAVCIILNDLSYIGFNSTPCQEFSFMREGYDSCSVLANVIADENGQAIANDNSWPSDADAGVSLNIYGSGPGGVFGQSSSSTFNIIMGTKAHWVSAGNGTVGPLDGSFFPVDFVDVSNGDGTFTQTSTVGWSASQLRKAVQALL
jgi:hypothetical protein